MSKASPAGYSAAQIALHWLIGLLLMFQVVFGEAMEELADAVREGEAIAGGDAVLGYAHIVAGFTVLALAVVRVALRLRSGAPAPIGGTPLTNRIAGAVHLAFYAVLFVAPITGGIAYFVTESADDIHKIAKPVIIVLLLLHVGGALLHVVKRDGTLRRMLVPRA